MLCTLDSAHCTVLLLVLITLNGTAYSAWCQVYCTLCGAHIVQLLVHAWINVEGRWRAGAYHLEYFTTIILQL